MPETVLITGASGLIGRHLSRMMEDEGYRVRTLSRHPKVGTEYFWDPAKGLIDPKALIDVDHLVHLAGAGIGDKSWSSARKEEILKSRVSGCELLFHTCQTQGLRLKSFISASAVGLYGSEPSTQVFTESDSAGNDFLAKVCTEWEKAALRFEEIGVRVVRIRTGIVLAADGGILPQMALPVRWGLGTPMGSGNQHIPWIHIRDVCRMYLEAIRNEHWKGAFNAVSTGQVTNREFTKALARLFHKPYWPMPLPGFLLRLVLGERSDLLLKGNLVQSIRLSEMDFQLRFEKLEAALKDLFPTT